MKIFKTLILALLILPALRGKAQFQNNAFENSYKYLNTLNGLSNDFVNQVVKDKNGFLWIATQNGLNRYDGVHIKTFYHKPDDPNSICNNYVLSLMADSKGRIWIGTSEGGISVYNCETQKIHSYLASDSVPNRIRPSEFITSFYEDDQMRIWVTTWGSGLYLFDEKLNGFEQYAKLPDEHKSLYCNKVKSIIQDKSGRLWVGLWAEGTSDTAGIQIFDPNKKSFTNYYGFLKNKLGVEVSKGLRSVLKYVHSMAIDNQNKLWVAGLLGMACIDLNDFTYKVYQQQDNSAFSTINSKTIRCITISPRNEVLAGSQDNGINILNPQTGNFSFIGADSGSERPLNNNNIKHILADENGLLFVSTMGGGLNISLPQQQEYKFINGKNIRIEGITTGKGITAIGKSGEIMLLGGNFGLIQWNTKTGEIAKYLKADAGKNNFMCNYILSAQAHGIAYISTSNNFYQLNTNTKKLSPIFSADKNQDNKFANANKIANWNKDTILILTEYSGFDLYDFKSNKSKHYDLNSRNIGFWYSISQLDEGHVLGGYKNGVLKINMKNSTVETLFSDSIPQKNIAGWKTNSIYCDRKKRWWFACDSSLGLLHLPNKGYTMFPLKRNELLIPLLDIQEDEQGNLWLHSDYGIYNFNTTTKAYTILHNNFVTSNHIANNQSYLDPETGLYYVTSKEGIWVVDTRLYYNETKLKPIIITEFYLSKGVLENKHDLIVDRDLLLSYKQNSFSIHFSNFDYEQNKSYQMEYRLEGIGTDWAAIPNSQILDFNNLTPGNYKLIIKYRNFSENHETSLNLNIHISKPFWQTWWFLLSCFLTLGGIILYYVRQKTERLKVKNAALELKVTQRTEELQLQKKQSEDLLLNILPEDIVNELKTNGSTAARFHQNVTVLFADFVNFTGISAKLSPVDLVKEIDRCFKAFDKIIDKYGIEKIKTIGDSYMAVGGLNKNTWEDTITTIKVALEIIDFVQKNDCLFEIRIGINSGPVIAGVVGHKKFAYDIWGSTVNIASRMESNGVPMKINISHNTYLQIKDQFKCEYRGKVAVKNMEDMEMYLVD